MEIVDNSNILCNDDALFVYPSILSGLLGNETIKSSCQKYNIKIKLMQKYVRMMKNGKRLYSDLGRPKLLDRESIVSIKDYCI